MEDLVLLKIFNTRSEAELAKHILQLHDIHVFVKDQETSSIIFTKGVQVLVRREDRERARELL